MKFNHLLLFTSITCMMVIISSCGEKSGKEKISHDIGSLNYDSGKEKVSRPETDIDSLNYAIGIEQGKLLKMGLQQSNIELNENMFLAGIKAVLNDNPDIFIEPNNARTVISSFFERRESQKKKENLETGRKFLAENATKVGIKTTPSGLQYKIERDGTGANPRSYDTVEVHYKGTLIDGKEFESSYSRNSKPIKFALNGVIKGWTEGIQLMKEGSKYTFYIPTELAYGENTYPDSPIEANVPLIFEVELLKVIPGKEPNLKK